MAYDEGLAERLRSLLRAVPGITEQRMFGGLALLADGHMFVGLLGETLMARVGPARYAAALQQPGARVMDFTGRPMKGYVFVDPAGIEDDAALAQWVTQCRAFVATLPPK